MYYKPSALNNKSQKINFVLNDFNKLEDIDKNCFDCGRRNPEYISINNGIYICKQCGLEHMLFPGGTSILIKNDLKLLSENEILFLKYGGNRQLYEFILNNSPSLINLPRKFLYTSHLVNYYQNQLQQFISEKNKPIRTKKELFKNKLFNLQISPNYSSKEFNSSEYNNTNINASFKRFNTTNTFNDNIIIYDDNTSFIKKTKYSNLNNNCKLDDSSHNYVFTQRTNNTHANTISNSTLTHVSDKTIEINNTNDYSSHKNKSYLKGTNIIYNKPKLTNNLLKTESHTKINSSKFNNSFYNLDNDKKNISYNHIEHIDNKKKLFFNQIKTPLNKKNKYDYYINNSNINRNIEENTIDYNNYQIGLNDISKHKFNTSVFIQEDNDNMNTENSFNNVITGYRNSLHFTKRKKNFLNKLENTDLKEKSVNNGRKIKEIIINKKIKNDKADTPINTSYLTHFKSRTLLENRKSIDINLQKTFDKPKKENNFSKDFKLNKIEKKDKSNGQNKTNTLEIKKNKLAINNSNSRKFKTFKREVQRFNSGNLNINNFNINQNLQKKFQKNEDNITNINNSLENKKERQYIQNFKNENSNIYKTFNNKINKENKEKRSKFLINENKFENINKIYNKANINSDSISKEKTNTKNKNNKKKENHVISFIKDNVEQFQILPHKEKKNNKDKKSFHRFYFFNKEKRNIDIKRNSTNILENNSNKKEKKFGRRNKICDNSYMSNQNLLSKSTNNLDFEETFKNSIRNRYKREKSLKKNK